MLAAAEGEGPLFESPVDGSHCVSGRPRTNPGSSQIPDRFGVGASGTGSKLGNFRSAYFCRKALRASEEGGFRMAITIYWVSIAVFVLALALILVINLAHADREEPRS